MRGWLRLRAWCQLNMFQHPALSSTGHDHQPELRDTIICSLVCDTTKQQTLFTNINLKQIHSSLSPPLYTKKYFVLKAEHIYFIIFLWLSLKSEYYRFLEPEKVSSSRNEKMIEKMQQLAKICIRIAKSKAVGGLIRGGWQQEGVVSCF